MTEHRHRPGARVGVATTGLLPAGVERHGSIGRILEPGGEGALGKGALSCRDPREHADVRPNDRDLTVCLDDRESAMTFGDPAVL